MSFPPEGMSYDEALRLVHEANPLDPARPPLSPEAAEWREGIMREMAAGTLDMRPIRERMAKVFKELGL